MNTKSKHRETVNHYAFKDGQFKVIPQSLTKKKRGGTNKQ